MSLRHDKIINAYNFLLKKESEGLSFKLDELAKVTQWKVTTIRTYINKQWKSFIRKESENFFCVGLKTISQDDFIKANSQRLKHSLNIQNDIDVCLDKARQFALLAVSVYNSPYSEFRAYGYIVNMVIAWTSLFHAIFQRKKIEYFYRNKDGDLDLIDNEPRTWDLSACIDQFWINNNPIKHNLKFLSGLRNKIEHRKLPALEPFIASHCQACLNNFENILVTEFGEEYVLGSDIALALQFGRFQTQSHEQALKQLQSNHYLQVINYMNSFEEHLPEQTLEDPKYRFSVFLSQKSSNHKSSADVSIEFVKPGSNEEAQINILMKEREKDKFKPKKIVEIMKHEGYSSFNMVQHTTLWRAKKAKGDSKYGITLSDGAWYWYDSWVDVVREYCKQNKL